MSEIKISFIIPVYNLAAGNYLVDCLKSLERVGIQDMEVWIVDDGSTDESGAICDTYEAKDSRFHVLHQENAGVSDARNAGIRCAKGEWLFFLDGDDLVPNGLEKLLHFEKYEYSDVVFFSYSCINGRGTLLWQSNNDGKHQLVEIDQESVDQMPDLILGETKGKGTYLEGLNLHSVWGSIYRRVFLVKNDIKFPTGIFRAEDLLFNLHTALCKPRYLRSFETIYYYRLREGSTTDRYWPEVRQNSRKVVTIAEKLLSEFDSEKEYYIGMNILEISSFLSCVIFDFCHPDNQKRYRIRRLEFMNLRAEDAYDEALRKADLRKLKRFGSRSRISAFFCRVRAFSLLSIYLKVVRLARYFVEKRH